MADSTRKTYNSRRYYVDGNTVREINPEEERRQRRLRREREEQRKREQEETLQSATAKKHCI